jgi:hypothetical protein
MGKIYGDANTRNVSCTVVYIDSGKVYNDAAHTDQIQTSDLKAAFEQNLVVDVSGALYETLAVSVSEGIATLKYVVIDGSTVTAASAVSKADIKPAKKIVDVYGENPVYDIFGAKVNELQRSLSINDNVISGTTFNCTKSCALTDYWGTGHFMVLHFSTAAKNVQKIEVGFLDGSGLSTLDSDMNGVWKLDPAHMDRIFTVKTTFNDGSVNVQEFNVKGIVLA